MDYGIYDRLQILLEAPNFTPSHDPVYLDFRRKYIRQHGSIPSDYARLGYDFMLFVGQALHRYGNYFQLGLSVESELANSLTARYDFKNARDNQQVPYVSFQSGELVRESDK